MPDWAALIARDSGLWSRSLARARDGPRILIPTAIGAYAEAAIASPDTTIEIPEAIPLPEAAAILMPFHLASMGLIERAKLVAGETVLIHAPI